MYLRLRSDSTRCLLSSTTILLSSLSRLSIVLAACCLLSQCPAAAQVKEVRRVLVLTEGSLSLPAVAAADREIRVGLEKSPYAIELYSEYSGTVLFPREASYRKLREWYRNRKPDVIIAAGPSPISFMTEAHKKLFGDTPIVICGSSEEQADNPKLDPEFTGVWMTIDAAKTLDAGLQLRPRTQHVVVVGGVSPYDKHVEAIVREQLSSYESKADFDYLTDLAMPALLERLRHLSDNTLVLYTSLNQDAAGTDFIPATESVPMVAKTWWRRVISVPCGANGASDGRTCETCERSDTSVESWPITLLLTNCFPPQSRFHSRQ